MYRKYRIVESIASSVSQYVSYRDQVYRYTRRPKSSAFELFAQSFIQAHIKENMKALHHWLSKVNSPVTGRFPSQMASNAESVSSWRHQDELYIISLNSWLFGHHSRGPFTNMD